MSIKHLLLALLHEQPAHGYELKKRFDETLGELWPLQQAQVYNNLRLLEQDGLIAPGPGGDAGSAPDRKTFRLTAAGAAELESWVQTPVRSSRQLKDAFYLKLMTLAGVLHRPADLLELIWRQREVYLVHLRELEAALLAAEAANDGAQAFLIDGALLHAEADLAWLDKCEDRLLHPQRRGEG
jgi:DNA-binding PadR family transcriptional regulator